MQLGGMTEGLSDASLAGQPLPCSKRERIWWMNPFPLVSAEVTSSNVITKYTYMYLLHADSIQPPVPS